MKIPSLGSLSLGEDVSPQHEITPSVDATIEAFDVPQNRSYGPQVRNWNSPGLYEVVHPSPPCELSWLFEQLVIVNNEEACLNLINFMTSSNSTRILGFVNAHALNCVWTNVSARLAFSGIDIILRDGVGIKMFLTLFGIPAGQNMNGTDFIPKLLAACKSKKIVLFGAQTTSLERAANQMRSEGLNIQHTLDGFQSIDQYIKAASDLTPEVIILAMGMPKQEMIAVRLKQTLPHGCLIINGGAILDFISKRVSRAPHFMRRLGLEWMFRLLIEPRRLFMRYVIGNPLFMARIIALRWHVITHPLRIR
jgi:N-acetylglucosaminyldiphosphoundecaprenol N-acetyl-beta-D-mannosaminyltransferase